MGFWKKVGNFIMGSDDGQEYTNKELFQFSLGVCGQNHTYNLISAWFFYFCVDVMFLDTMAVSLIIGASRVWDAINDPIVGNIIDRHTFKNGEKLRPYLKLMPIPIGICATLMFVDVGLTQSSTLLYLFVIYFLWDFFYSFQDVSQWSMTAMMATTSEGRGKAAQWARIAGGVGGWLPGLLTIILGNCGILGITQKQVFLVAGIVFGFGGMMLSMFTHKAKERAPIAKPESMMANIKLLFKNKIVVLLVVASVAQSFMLTIQQVYFFKYMVQINVFGIEINGLTMSFVFGILVGLPGTLAQLFTSKFARRVGGMKNVLLIATIGNILCRVAAFFVGYEGIRIVYTGILLALCGIPNGMTSIASTTLWGDSVDFIEWQTGKRNEGIVFSMQNFVAKITSGISTVFAGLTLTLLNFDATKYDAGLPQSDLFYKWVWPIYMLAPAISSVFYLIPLLFIKYNIKDKHEIERKLKARRAHEENLTKADANLIGDVRIY